MGQVSNRMNSPNNLYKNYIILYIQPYWSLRYDNISFSSLLHFKCAKRSVFVTNLCSFHEITMKGRCTQTLNPIYSFQKQFNSSNRERFETFILTHNCWKAWKASSGRLRVLLIPNEFVHPCGFAGMRCPQTCLEQAKNVFIHTNIIALRKNLKTFYSFDIFFL